MRTRLEKLVRQGCLSRSELEKFLLLEMKMLGGAVQPDWLLSYHLSDDDYRPLLEKVLKGLCLIGEPHASEKLHAYFEELGIMSPAVYNTPWELTLTELDQEFNQ